MKLRITIFAVLSILAVTFLVNYISNNFKNTIVEAEKRHLLSITHSSSSHIETYFKELENTAHSLVYNPKTSEALLAFTNSFNKIKNNKQSHTKYLQNNYNNSSFSYSKNHKKFHNYFYKEKKIHGVYNLFLIDIDGNIIYAVKKENDFATNLYNGPYFNSSLAKVFKKAKIAKNSKVAYEDFKFYEPSDNRPASFLALSVFEKNIMIGVLAIEIPIDKIDTIMTFNGKVKEVGLGNSGETYIVGKDLLMRTNSRFISTINNEKVQKLKSTIGIIQVNTPSVHNALKGKNGFIATNNYRGIDAYSAYSPINIFENKWAMIAEINKEEVDGYIQDDITILFIESLLTIVVLILIFSRIIYKHMVAPLEEKNKNLQVKINIKDEQIKISKTVSDEYKQAFDLLSIISKTDTKGIITYVNDHFCELTGYLKDELIGTSHNILTHPDTPKGAHKNLWETISSKRIWKGKLKNLNKYKKSYTVDLTIIPIIDKEGDIKEFMSIVHKT